jgi:hypothetical protein
MKKVIIATLLVTSFFSCKEKNENNDSTKIVTEQVETEKTETKSPKFEDVNDCSQYSNLYQALPHLDAYKNMNFGELECSSTKERNAFSISLKASYSDKKTGFEVFLFEVSGESAKEELNNVNMAKASFNTLTKVPSSNTFKSSLSIFENASVKIDLAESTNESCSVVYLGTYKDKYSIWINIKMNGKIDVAKVDAFIKEYLEAIKMTELN